jgi:hypothetical protein
MQTRAMAGETTMLCETPNGLFCPDGDFTSIPGAACRAPSSRTRTAITRGRGAPRISAPIRARRSRSKGSWAADLCAGSRGRNVKGLMLKRLDSPPNYEAIAESTRHRSGNRRALSAHAALAEGQTGSRAYRIDQISHS